MKQFSGDLLRTPHFNIISQCEVMIPLLIAFGCQFCLGQLSLLATQASVPNGPHDWSKKRVTVGRKGLW